MQGKHVKQVLEELEAEDKGFTTELLNELLAVRIIGEFASGVTHIQALSKHLEGKSAEFREAFKTEWQAWADEGENDDDELDEFLLDMMSVTDVVVELCAGYTRKGFTIEEKRFNKLIDRLCDAYDDEVRIMNRQRERIMELTIELHDERNKTLFERLTGRWRK